VKRLERRREIFPEAQHQWNRAKRKRGKEVKDRNDAPTHHSIDPYQSTELADFLFQPQIYEVL
jgi:hypothetical protein